MYRDIRGKVLFLSYLYPPIGGQGLPGAQRSVKFIKYMKNIQPFVLTIKETVCPSYLQLNYIKSLPINNEVIQRTTTIDPFKVIIGVKNRLRSIPIKGTDKDEAESPNYKTTKASSYASRSVIQTIKDLIHDFCYYPDEASNWILPALFHGAQIIRREKIDIIFATGIPWSSLVTAFLLHKLTRVPFIVDFRDPWVGNPYHESRGEIFDRLDTKLEKVIVESAALVSANTNPLKEEFLKRYPYLPSDKFIVLPNGFDEEEFRNVETFSGNHNRLVLAHAGLLYKQRDPSPIFKAFENILKSNPDTEGKIKFVQIGDVQTDYNPKEMFSYLYDSDMAEILSPMPYKDCINELNRADVLVIVQPETLTQVPSKLYDYLCLKKPILTIAPRKGALGGLIEKAGFGHVIEHDEIGHLEKIIYELYKEKVQKGALKAEYPNMSLFDVRKITEVLQDKMFSVINRHR